MSANVDPATQRRDVIAASKAEAAAKKVAALPPYTFKVATSEYINAFGKEKWRSVRAAKAFAANLNRYVMPVIGHVAIRDVTRQHVLAIFDPLYERTPIGARVLGACEAVYGYAKTRLELETANPFQFKNQLEHIYPKKPDSRHFKTIDYRDLPALFAQLIAMGDDPAALAARFQIACALRPTEARLMRFDYIDATASTFTLPMTKNGRAFTVLHLVVLTDLFETAFGGSD